MRATSALSIRQAWVPAIRRGRDGAHYWCISAKNGRTLGRSAVGFTTAAAAGEHLLQVLSQHELLRPAVLHPTDADFSWTWIMSLHQELAVTAGRTYERNATCQRAQQSFRHALRHVADEQQQHEPLLRT